MVTLTIVKPIATSVTNKNQMTTLNACELIK
jgi:hypothetical protein